MKIALSTGIYYAYRLPSGWELYPYRDDTFPKLNHPDVWEQYLVHTIATGWAKALGRPSSDIAGAIRLNAYAFPRGRISTDASGKVLVLHGNDNRFIKRRNIQTAFGIGEGCVWEKDEHEQCLKDDKESVRDLLEIREDWPAV